MPSYQDLIALVRNPQAARVIPAVWDFSPCHAGAVGGVPSFLAYYVDVDEKLRLQRKLKELLPEALILPGVAFLILVASLSEALKAPPYGSG